MTFKVDEFSGIQIRAPANEDPPVGFSAYRNIIYKSNCQSWNTPVLDPTK
jgi:hypothetical protein